jgi:hypothetical protein
VAGFEKVLDSLKILRSQHDVGEKRRRPESLTRL